MSKSVLETANHCYSMSYIRTAVKGSGIQSVLTQRSPEDGIVNFYDLCLYTALLAIEPIATLYLANIGCVRIIPLVISQLDVPVLVITRKRKVYIYRIAEYEIVRFTADCVQVLIAQNNWSGMAVSNRSDEQITRKQSRKQQLLLHGSIPENNRGIDEFRYKRDTEYLRKVNTILTLLRYCISKRIA